MNEQNKSIGIGLYVHPEFDTFSTPVRGEMVTRWVCNHGMERIRAQKSISTQRDDVGTSVQDLTERKRLYHYEDMLFCSIV